MKNFHRTVITVKTIRVLRPLSSAMSPDPRPVRVVYRRRHS